MQTSILLNLTWNRGYFLKWSFQTHLNMSKDYV